MANNLSLKAFVVLMKAANTLEKKSREDISVHGMKMSDFTILEALYHKGRQTIKQISESVLISTGSITYVIDKLEKKGLLERSNCAEDRRVVYIQITDEGQKQMDEIFPEHTAMIEEIFSCLSDDEKQTAIDILKKVGKQAEDK